MINWTTDEDTVNVDQLRSRLVKMTDAELLRFGKDNHYMCSPYANMGKPQFFCPLRQSQR